MLFAIGQNLFLLGFLAFASTAMASRWAFISVAGSGWPWADTTAGMEKQANSISANRLRFGRIMGLSFTGRT